jgi:hypothetical protein
MWFSAPPLVAAKDVGNAARGATPPEPKSVACGDSFKRQREVAEIGNHFPTTTKEPPTKSNFSRPAD